MTEWKSSYSTFPDPYYDRFGKRRKDTTSMPKTGAYRELFKRGLNALIASKELNADDLADAKAYLTMLDNPDYKFGRLTWNRGSSGDEYVRGY